MTATATMKQLRSRPLREDDGPLETKGSPLDSMSVVKPPKRSENPTKNVFTELLAISDSDLPDKAKLHELRTAIAKLAGVSTETPHGVETLESLMESTAADLRKRRGRRSNPLMSRFRTSHA